MGDLKVQRRDNSLSRDWEDADFLSPGEVAQANREYGWQKYRIEGEKKCKSD